MEPNIFQTRDELIRSTTLHIKDIPVQKLILPKTEDSVHGFKPLIPEIFPSEAKPLILDHPTYVKKDIIPFNLADRQEQIATDRINLEKADEILVESRNPNLLLAKLKKLEDVDLEKKIDTIFKAYELLSLKTKVAEAKAEEEKEDEPDFFELREGDMESEEDEDSDRNEKKYDTPDVPHIDINKLRNVHYGSLVPPGAEKGYDTRELDAIIQFLKSEGHQIKVSGTKTMKANNILNVIEAQMLSEQVDERLKTTFGSPSRGIIPTFLDTPVAPKSPMLSRQTSKTGNGLKLQNVLSSGKFIQFGNLLVDTKKLMDRGVLSVNEWSRSKDLPVKVNKFKNRPISDEMRDSIMFILNKGIVPDLSDLSQVEKEYLYQIIGRSRIQL